MSEPQSRRNTLYYYEPTEAQLKLVNPVGKKAIIEWYNREKLVLETRLKRVVKRKFQVTEIEVDRESKKVVRRGREPKVHELELWKLTAQDHAIYSQHLEQRFASLKKEHNARVAGQARNV